MPKHFSEETQGHGVADGDSAAKLKEAQLREDTSAAMTEISRLQASGWGFEAVISTLRQEGAELKSEVATAMFAPTPWSPDFITTPLLE
eukprot:6229546-Amphidinium_carterae.1